MTLKEEVQEARERQEKYKKLGAKREAKAEELHEAIGDALDHIFRLRKRRRESDDVDLREELKARIDELEESITGMLDHYQQALENSENAKDLRREAGERIRRLKEKMASNDPDARLVAMLCNYGLDEDDAKALVEEAKSENVDVALAAALCQQESGFKNIFGCDFGAGVAFCHEGVTEPRAKQLRAGGRPNGIGWTQLTSFSLVDAANQEGGSWIVRNQLRIGFRYLAELMGDLGERTGIGAYNGGPGNPQLGYADDVLGLKGVWAQRVDAAQG